jgi:formyl-CoA transferase
VLDTLDIFEDKHLEARDTIVEVDHPTRGKWKFIAPPFRLSNSHVDVKPAPLLGQHTTEVLQQELGLDQGTVAKLADENAIGVLEPAGAAIVQRRQALLSNK